MGEENQVQDLGSTWNLCFKLAAGPWKWSVVEHLPSVYAKNPGFHLLLPPPHKTKGEETKQQQQKSTSNKVQWNRWVCPAIVGSWRQGLEGSYWACEEEKIICSFEGDHSPRLKATALEEGRELFYCWWESPGLNTNVGTFPWRSGKKTRRYWPSQSKDSP